ncbi:SH3 domain-containing protein [Nitrosospira sp. Nl5]|uniref:SH3 domain-containing protein n=1 Tax=Nitrosospira sp. Nl5 TaxID=200120 RepID=UPI000B87DA88|nr:SH3 domain-containing protein [Nitrosospira sp. Nl5]
MQSAKLHSLQEARAGRVPWVVLLALLGLNMTACNTLPKSSPPEIPVDCCVKEQHEIERLQKLLSEKDAQQDEIARLQKLVAEKEAQLRTHQVRQQEEARTLQRTISQAAHAQVKLRRLATRPAAASTIAEVEVAMENLNSSPSAESEQVMQAQAQRLVDAASASYEKGNYVAAMDYAAHARGLIDMIKHNRNFKLSGARRATTAFEVPIPLRMTANSNLRQKPVISAAVIDVLKKNSKVIAEAYRGDWLHVHTADEQSGWVLNTLVETQAGRP